MNYFEIFAAAVGLLYLWLEYKANVWLWSVGIIMPLCYIFIFYESKFYAGMTVNVYYLLASIYGWWKWKINKKGNIESSRIKHIPINAIWKLALVFALIFSATGYVLKNFTNSTVVFSDSFINALSIIGMWMLAHKYMEQWWVWFVTNAVSTGVYFISGLKATAVMYAVYAIVSISGYYNWKKIKKSEDEKLTSI